MDPQPASMGSIGNPVPQAECPFPHFFISVLVMLIPFLPCLLNPLRLHLSIVESLNSAPHPFIDLWTT